MKSNTRKPAVAKPWVKSMKDWRALTEEDRVEYVMEVCAAIQSGRVYTEISEAFHLGMNLISCIAERNGLASRGRWRRRSPPVRPPEPVTDLVTLPRSEYVLFQSDAEHESYLSTLPGAFRRQGYSHDDEPDTDAPLRGSLIPGTNTPPAASKVTITAAKPDIGAFLASFLAYKGSAPDFQDIEYVGALLAAVTEKVTTLVPSKIELTTATGHTITVALD